MEPKRYPLTWMKKDRDLWERMLAEMPVHRAAPDMLAVLNKIEQQLDYGQLDAALKIARAAIAKATA